LEVEKLQQFEDEAKKERIGAWGINAGRLSVRAPSSVAFSVFVPERESRTRATSKAHSPVPILATASGGTPIRPTNSGESSRAHAKDTPPLGKIDINTATEKELKMIPGIGPVMAARIIAARPFRSADDLKKVSGIGDKKYATIRPYFQ
jgi:competence ComEA-like helix-hairpin-helix protein